jgi:hypothetical protein
MTPWLMQESYLVEMTSKVRDFSDLKDFVHRLRAAGYTDTEICKHGYEVRKRELARREADRLPERVF